MRILIVNQFHKQPGRGGSARLNSLAEHWSRAGCEVVVVSSTVDHASGQVPPEYHGRFVTEERSDGARVLRSWTLGARKSIHAGRVARDLSFAVTSAISSLVRTERPDLVLASSPPLFAGLSGAAVARFRDVPFVFEARDLWPDYAVDLGILSGKPARLAYAMEASIYRQAALIVTVTPPFGERLAAKGVDASKLLIIPNGVDAEQFAPGPQDAEVRKRLGWEGRFVVLYVGVLGPAQALHQVVDAARLLSNSDPDVLVAFVGEGSEKAKLQAHARGLENVQFHSQVARESVPALLRSADVVTATLKRLRSFEEVYPAKVFEALGCGRPLLLAGAGAVAKLVDESRGGIVVPPEDPDAWAGGLRALRADPARSKEMGARGAAYVREHYDRGALAAQYLDRLRIVARR